MRIQPVLLLAAVLILALGLSLGAAPSWAASASLSGTAAARAAAVSGPVIDVAPLSHDFGIVNVGSTETFT